MSQLARHSLPFSVPLTCGCDSWKLMNCILRFVFICILRFVFICILGFVSYPLRRYPPSFCESDGHLEICKNGCFILFASNMFLFHSHSPKVTTTRTFSHGVSSFVCLSCIVCLSCFVCYSCTRFHFHRIWQPLRLACHLTRK